MTYKLTKRRLEAARPILEKYRAQLHESHHINCNLLEKELRECWGLGYQELKDVIIDLAKTLRYRYVAAYYMQYQNAPGPVSEFKRALGRLYGIEHYDNADRDGLREAFWKHAFTDE